MDNNIYNFTHKLCQKKVFNYVRTYIDILKNNSNKHLPPFLCLNYDSKLLSPVSINLDITLSCNYRCEHCIDKKNLNITKKISIENIIDMLILLRLGGLQSVILIGGGEPTLHPDFKKIVYIIKTLGLQCAIVSNGSNINKILEVVKYLSKGDWIRLSLDAGSEELFQKIHRPLNSIRLKSIIKNSSKLKQINPDIELGYSFIVIPPEIKEINMNIVYNYEEIEKTTLLAKNNFFDYISFKVCLIRDKENKEIIPHIKLKKQHLIIIKKEIQKAMSQVNNKFKVIVSPFLLNILKEDKIDTLKIHPNKCYMQAFRQVISPLGIFGCPAYRGDVKSLITAVTGYINLEEFIKTCEKTQIQIKRFDASIECKDIICMYNSTNWYLNEVFENKLMLNKLGIFKNKLNTFL